MHRQKQQGALERLLAVHIKIDGYSIVRLHYTREAASGLLNAVVDDSVMGETNVQNQLEDINDFCLVKIVADY